LPLRPEIGAAATSPCHQTNSRPTPDAALDVQQQNKTFQQEQTEFPETFRKTKKEISVFSVASCSKEEFLRQSPFATTGMNQPAGIAQDLELLADFILHMPVVRMELFQFAREGVGVGGCELTRSCPLARSSRTFAFSQIPFAISQTAQVSFAEAADDVQDIQRPAALGDGNVFQRFDAPELFADFALR
jgi:hypothetical protein